MAFVLNRFDENKQQEGVWMDFGGSQFLIAYTGTKFTKELNKLRKPFERQIQKNTINPETLSELYQKAIARTVLLDWKGVFDFDGNEIPYSFEIAVEALKTDPELFSWVTETSTEIGNYEKEAKEAKVKKS